MSPEDFIIDVEKYTRKLAFRRKHRDATEPRGDVPKRLRDYWNNPEKRKAYPNLYNQIRYVVWSVVREAITHNPRWKITHGPLPPPEPDDEELTAIEIIYLMLEEGGFSEDERKYLCSYLEWEGSSPRTDADIERKQGLGFKS